MTTQELKSAPDEGFLAHVESVVKHWQALRARILPTLARLLRSDEESVDETVELMLRCHDVGKLTALWQARVSNGQSSLPPHAAIGAAFLFTLPTPDEQMRNAAAFAIAIHHTDTGLVAANIESPDALAIARGLVDETGALRWHDLARDCAQNAGLDGERLAGLTVDDLRRMARELRKWFRGASLVEQHVRRLQAGGMHHVLKICDVRAAAERGELKYEAQFVTRLCEGGLIA